MAKGKSSQLAGDLFSTRLLFGRHAYSVQRDARLFPSILYRPTGLRSGTLLRELLDGSDALTGEADEDCPGWRLAVDPILDVVAVRVALANLVVGLADGGDHFFTIHAENGLALLNGFFHFRRQRIEPLHRGGTLLREIKERRKELLQIVRTEVRYRLAELQKNRAAHAGLHPRRALILGRSGLHAGHGGAAH